MRLRRNILLAAAPALLAAFPLRTPASGATSAANAVYRGAIVVDAASGRVLFEDHADEISPPASMTKLMTFAVLDDRIRSGALTLRTPVAVTAADARVGMLPDSTSVRLKTGETFPVEELIYAMMIQSANDAAYALAHASAGSVPVFVEWMNAKARALGMTRTTFRSPNGLPPTSRRIADGDLTTPRDFSTLCRYLLQQTDILRYTSVKSRPFGAGRRFPPTPMTNHNHLLGRIAGVDGLKTGFTDGAGFCLSATASRDGRRIIAVMMDSPDSKTRDLKIAQLIERGFAVDSVIVPAVRVPGSPAGAPESSPTRPAPAADPGIRYPGPGAIP
jgi:D-alanyl-D-alanine carboxypeptidase (penicillin-binding protein 5/6)